ncbi:DUF5304 domain-containing protein [Streptomyces purpureus]|uniref:DUF5304 domain-containing protein n=1 Tax=Streptomyces purpureus TaxID=1951 RepID=A0A918LMR5_9ACTN|nr:DUF5304 domain-containing protein [Streptomyces purpureus]GGT22755.1 hypothetical protein GCM10014713_14460 [Streptomyces purpureus]
MSDATERPAADSDAWAKACAEDLEAEKARRRAEQGGEPGSAADEFRKLFDAVADKVSSLKSPLFGMAAQGGVQQFVQQAKAVVEPVIERNPQVFDHLAAAGNELLAAYRSAVEGHERRWTREQTWSDRASAQDGPATEPGTEPDGPRGNPGSNPGSTPGTKKDDEGPATGEQIDLD